MNKQLEDTRKKMIQVLSDTLKLVKSNNFNGGVLMVNICRKDGGLLNGGVIGGEVDEDIAVIEMIGMISHIKGDTGQEDKSHLN